MSTTTEVATVGSRPELIRAAYRRLQRMGFADPEAANLTALKNGFEIVSQPWKVGELTSLAFVRELARARGEWSSPSDRASSDSGDDWRLPGPRPREPGPPDGRVTLQSLLKAASDHGTLMPGRLPGSSNEQGREGR
jgi:hypothetical protein